MRRVLLQAMPPPVRVAMRRARRAVWRARHRPPELKGLADAFSLTEGVAVISFDLFDTLVERDVEPVELIGKRAAVLASERLGAPHGPRADWLIEARRRTEIRLRREAWVRGDDPECRLDELVPGFLAWVAGVDAAERHGTALVRAELELEARHLVLAPGALDLLAALTARGQRIVVASDTWYAAEDIGRLLAAVGAARFVRAIYVSSELAHGKSSGRLFRRLLERERVAPAEVLHIGDSFEADVRGAAIAGIRGAWLRDPAALVRRRRVRADWMARAERGELPA